MSASSAAVAAGPWAPQDLLDLQGAGVDAPHQRDGASRSLNEATPEEEQMTAVVTLTVDDHGMIPCPLCPDDGRRTCLHVMWELGAPLLDGGGEDAHDIGGAVTGTWTVACLDGHVLVTAADWHGDDFPPAPHFDDVRAWLADRTPPLVRDHLWAPRLGDGGDGPCCHCQCPRDDHAEGVEG